MKARLLLLGGQSVALGLTMAFLVVPVSALFLDEYGADALPYTYLAVAAAGVIVSWAMTRAQRRLSLSRLAASVVGIYLILAAAGWLVLVRADGVWVTFPLLVMFPLTIPIGFVLIGSQAGRLLDVRQLKAHFPRVAAGFSVGFALGGLLAAALLSLLDGPRHLLGFDVVAGAVLLSLVVATARAFPAELGAAPEPPATTPVSASGTERRRDVWRLLRGNRMIALLLGYQVLSAAVTQLLDYILWERAAARFPDPSSLARFQGLFGATMNVISVVFVFVAAGWLLTRFGIGLGLVANPLGVLVLLAGTIVVGSLSGSLALGFFVLVCAQAVTDISLTDGTTRASVNTTYQALRAHERLRAQTLIEGAGGPLALGVVGALLLAFDAFGLEILTVVVVTLLLTSVWLVLAVLGYREYGVSLREAMSTPALDPVEVSIDDATSPAAVTRLLTSSELHDVQSALEALAGNGRDISEQVLLLLDHPDPARRILALRVAVHADQLGIPKVRTGARALLDDPDADVAAHAAAALVRVTGSSDAGSAWLAALLGDDPVARAGALTAAATLPHGTFVPHLVELASSRSASGDVLDALIAHCGHLVPLAGELLSDPSVPSHTRERLIHVLGQSATSEARDLLVAHLHVGDPAIVEAAARCLVAVGHQAAPDGPDVAPQLATLAVRAARCLAVLTRLGDRPEHEPLACALRDELGTAARRTEVLLGLVHDPRAVGFAISALSSSDERRRSMALETLEVTLGRTLAQTVLAIVDITRDERSRLALLGRHAPTEARSLGEWLRELVADGDGYWSEPWLRACAMYAAPSALPDGDAAALVASLRDAPDPDVAETARWLWGRWVPAAAEAARAPAAAPR